MEFRAKRKLNPFTLFYLKISLLISLVIVAVSFGISMRNNRLLLDALRQQAASYYDLILRVRRWNIDYGGIYVVGKRGEETASQPSDVGVDAGPLLADGRILILKSPELMTREISQSLSDTSEIEFHLASLHLLNKVNGPDDFEERALSSFLDGAGEYWELERRESGPVFRYMAPLLFEESCKKCHLKSKHDLREVLGGISVTIPFKQTEASMGINRLSMVGFSFLTLALLLGSTYIMLNHLGEKLEAVQCALLEASIRDELTGLHNRRYLMTRYNEEFERARRRGTMLGLLMMDIDHFKLVNDSHGHLVGDEVLHSVGQTLAGMLRDYDVGGRYGGEEFAVVLAETTAADMFKLAERARERIGEMKHHSKVDGVHVTISIGVAALRDDDTAETLLQRADAALYRAKDEGRNRTVLL